ncbi:hypothetical protein HBI56_210350 [Parastagonospora nodorum]|uniref:Uncharacterized protein n=1 Tax=Phaeosphaeria nodorum (strain SN15 / ATCC MYA-4574 / FGSC 10173) TaxID=321614 RepID=A0A7U2F3K8_PHANO|nr:hypothetical protein HBH56_213970 [Parastagonospora nodorum]QRC97821.1 hypothetical protein JI435_411070 [Parastagonospora nodorum SN15]KAH3923138.1 hypothetical protein HBH54_215640 [Parastagonospora nodorum]KAH3941755.1 hypothetical protein HBH53_196470 [Parastagonospora nodorum]KAH3960991.1 hypothetical protein HBH51_186300 [Parastagonospora nodorum]
MSGGQPIAAVGGQRSRFPWFFDGRKNVQTGPEVGQRCKEAAIVLMYSSTIKRKSPQSRVTMDYTAADLGA